MLLRPSGNWSCKEPRFATDLIIIESQQLHAFLLSHQASNTPQHLKPKPALLNITSFSDSFLQYAERLPIGKEDIIQGIPASKVLAFYKRWYRPENMAVIAVGDFANPQAVVGMIEKRLGKCRAADNDAQQIPK